MVRVESEEWRASAPQPISKGTRIIVTEVTGTKLVVEPIESA
jgi:membrane protein implicated in regulation of membrane protease activity